MSLFEFKHVDDPAQSLFQPRHMMGGQVFFKEKRSPNTVLKYLHIFLDNKQVLRSEAQFVLSLGVLKEYPLFSK